MNNTKDKKIINISKQIFITAIVILFSLIIVSTIFTYILQKGSFETYINGYGDKIVNYNNYIISENQNGINIFKAIFSPILIFFSDGFLQPLVLSIFLLIISGVFQIMLDCGGMQAIVNKIVEKFKEKKYILLIVMSLFFMILGSFFGLFEETLLLLPMVITLCISLGYDAITAFIVCTLSTGFGFATAITNPFTVIYASDLINASIISGIWFRILMFLVFYLLVLLFLYLHIKKLNSQKNKNNDNQVFNSENICETISEGEKSTQETNFNKDKKIFISYVLFFIVAFVSIITFSSISALRDYSTPLLAIVFLIGGSIAGIVSFGLKNTLKSFKNGLISALPAVVMICFAFAVKYILVEGMIIDTITYSIKTAIINKPVFAKVLIIFGTILILEFFISSSTAKAVFVMGVLSGIIQSGALPISPEMLVLIYILSDGFTNVLFPTSPVLLIGLSMTDQTYLSWLKKSKFLFLTVFILAILFMGLALLINY